MTLSGMRESKLFVFGGLLGIGTQFLLSIITKIFAYIGPYIGINVDLQAITIKTTGLGTTVGTGLSVYAEQIFTKIGLSLPSLLYAFIGGGLFVLAGAFLFDLLKLQEYFDTKQAKIAVIFVLAGLGSGALLSMSITIPTLSAMIIMAVNALILSFGLVALDKQAKTNLIP